LGQFVPGGTQISTNSWGITRNTKTFGPDVEIFRPERWMDATSERRIEMERTCELIFGFGRYMCAGKTVAFMELNKIFVEVGHADTFNCLLSLREVGANSKQLFREFDFQIVNPKVPFTDALYSMFTVKDMWMRVTSRVH
jgi:hypothetical protein